MTFRWFLRFTALTMPACLVLLLWLDQPAALFFHQYTGWAAPFFGAFTNGVDAAHYATHVNGIPLLWLALGLAYVLGRWVLQRRWATVFLVTLLTHLASVVTSQLLKGMVHRLRPTVLFGPGYEGLGLWASGPYSDSFPSTHVAIYLSLLLPLAVLLPRWRWPLLVLPGLIGVGRWVLGVHYLSDVWFSVWLVAAWTLLFSQLYRFPQLKPATPLAPKATA